MSLSALLASQARGQSSVTLAWDRSTSSGVTAYRLYRGSASGNYSGYVSVGTATTATSSNLTPGSRYYFAVTAVDSTGLESAFSNEIGYTVPVVSNAAPTVVLTSPAAGSSYTAPASINLTASVVPNGHSIVNVQFYNGSTLLGSDSTAPYTATWNGATAGTYNLTALLVYDSGLTLTSAAVPVTVGSTAAPTIALTSPTTGSSFTAPASINLAASVVANGHNIVNVQFYNGYTLLGSDSTAPYTATWSGAPAGTYNLTALLVYDGGLTLYSAATTITVSPGQVSSNLTFASTSGTYAVPFVASGGMLSQPSETGLSGSGRAAYTFNITNAGNYLVSAQVSAPNSGQNSFYVNIDAEPTDPLMIWDIPVTSATTSRTVSWRGTGDSEPATAQFSPKAFYLAAGTHQLIIRGREANTKLGTITIALRPPRARIWQWWAWTGNTGGNQPPDPNSMVIGVEGQPGATYNVLASQDLRTWTSIGTTKVDDLGVGQIIDYAGSTMPSRYYRLQEQ